MLGGFAQGLGGFGSGYIQGAQAGAQIASQRLMNAYRQLLMQQAQQEQQGQGLAGAYLGGGGQPASAPGIPMLPQIGGAPAPAPAPQPPMPGQSSAPAAPPAAMAPRNAPVMPSDEVQADVAADGTGTPAAAQAIANQAATQPAPADSGGTATPPAPSAAAPAAGAAVPDQLGAHPLDQEIVQMVRSSIAASDPRPIAQAIHAARPDADPATVFKAAEMVMKLSQSGNKLEQAYLLQVMRDAMSRYKWQTPSATALSNQGAAAARQDKSIAAAGQRQEAALGAAAERQQTGIAAAGERQDKSIAAADARAKANRDAMAERQKEREAAIDQRAAQSRADRRTVAAFSQRYKALSGQLNAVKAAVAGEPGGQATPEQKKAIQRIGQQMVQMWSEAGKAGVELPRPSELNGQ